MDYKSEYEQARILLDGGNFNLCSVQCGRILESILKDFLNDLLINSKLYNFQSSIESLLINGFKNSKRLTLGKLILLIKKTNAISELCRYHGLDKNGVNSIDFDTMATIRNKASHEGNDDSAFYALADAYIIYGYLSKLLGLVEPFYSGKKAISTNKTQIESRPTKKIKLDNKDLKKTLNKTKDFTFDNKELKNNGSKEKDFLLVQRNKSSGQLFIHVEKEKDSKARFILPNGKVKSLSLDLFEEAKEAEIKLLIANHAITKDQIEKLKYLNGQSIKPSYQRKLIRTNQNSEPDYIIKYRSMLKHQDTVPSKMLDIINREGRITWKDLKEVLIKQYGYKDSGSFSASLRLLNIDGYVDISGKGEDKVIKKLILIKQNKEKIKNEKPKSPSTL